MEKIIDLDYLIGAKVYFGKPLNSAELSCGKLSLAKMGAYFYSKQPSFKEECEEVESEEWILNGVKNDCLIYLTQLGVK